MFYSLSYTLLLNFLITLPLLCLISGKKCKLRKQDNWTLLNSPQIKHTKNHKQGVKTQEKKSPNHKEKIWWCSPFYLHFSCFYYVSIQMNFPCPCFCFSLCPHTRAVLPPVWNDPSTEFSGIFILIFHWLAKTSSLWVFSTNSKAGWIVLPLVASFFELVYKQDA